MRILLTATNSIDTNGTTQRMLFIAKALAEDSRNVIGVSVPGSARTKSFLAKHAPKIRPYFFPACGVLREIRYKLQACRAFDAQVAIGFCVGLRFLLPFVRRPDMLIVYDWDELMSAHSKKRPLTRLKNRLVEASSLRSGQAWLAASEYLYYRLSEKCETSRVFYLPNGYDSIIDRRLVADKKILASAIGCLNILYVGSVSREYQIWDLIPLAELALRNGLDWKIHIIGTGRDMETFKKRVASSAAGRMIVLHGRVEVEKIPQYLACADLLVFPFPPTIQNIARCPLKTYQYIVSGKPVVTNHVGEVAKALGDRGNYFTAGNIESMLDACQRSLARRAGEMSLSLPEIPTLEWGGRVSGLTEWLSKRYLVEMGFSVGLDSEEGGALD